jgi:hypothetical protein
LAGLGMTWHDQYGGTGEMVDRLADGELDVVSILTEGTVAAIDNGLPVTVVQTYVASPLQWGIFAPAGSGRRPGDTSRIAISRFGSGSHLMAFVLADRDRWSLDPQQFVPVGSLKGAVAAFAEGRADLFLWDQFMTRPLVDSGAFDQIGVLETPWPSFVIAARTDVLTGRTAEVGRVVDAVVAQATALHQRAEVTAELAARYELPTEAVSGWLASTRFAPRQGYEPAITAAVRAALAQVKAA